MKIISPLGQFSTYVEAQSRKAEMAFSRHAFPYLQTRALLVITYITKMNGISSQYQAPIHKAEQPKQRRRDANT